MVITDLENAEISDRIKTADLVISDLDDTLANSPAERNAYMSLLRPSYLSNPYFWCWCTKTAYSLAQNREQGKRANAKTEAFRKYVSLFLHDEIEKWRLRDNYSKERARKMLYKGVEEFFGLFPKDTKKLLVTRNIKEMANGFANALELELKPRI